MADSVGTSSYVYDERSGLTSYTPPAPSGHGAISYTYNNLGQKKTVTNGSLVVGYDYYANGWLKRVNRGASLVSKYTYDAVGNRTRIDLGDSILNGTYTTYDYDADPRYRVDAIHHRKTSPDTLLAEILYYDPLNPTDLTKYRDGMGNPRAMKDWNPLVTYTYDEYSRLVQTGGYDWVGNRTGTGWYTNAADELETSPGQQYTYLMTGSLFEQKDSLGVLQKTYTYTYANLLSTVTHAGVPNPSTMTWDAADHRISFTSSTDPLNPYAFVYDVAAGVPAVIEEVHGGTSIYYIREPRGELVARMTGTTGTNLQYYHFDAIGSTKLLTDAIGAVTDTYTYDAWGNVSARTGATMQPYLYAGRLGYYTHYQDMNLPLVELGVRFYDMGVGRFTQTDPLLDGVNHYLYVKDRPTRHVDPSGLLGSNGDECDPNGGHANATQCNGSHYSECKKPCWQNIFKCGIRGTVLCFEKCRATSDVCEMFMAEHPYETEETKTRLMNCCWTIADNLGDLDKAKALREIAEACGRLVHNQN